MEPGYQRSLAPDHRSAWVVQYQELCTIGVLLIIAV
jgi:hypothetical protein